MEWSIVFVYLLVLGALTLLGAPLSAWLFRALPKKGAAFALPTALTLFTIVVFWVGQLTFGVHTLVIGLGVVLAAAVIAIYRGVSPEWRTVGVTYAIFSIGFLIMLAFRASTPGITPAGGEQFLHFGLVNALERADSLPPEDMWYAGKELKYYYGTQLQVTSLSMLTGTPVRFGFNLGIATFYGMLFVVAYGIGAAVVRRRGYSYRFGGLFGAFFVALAGPTTVFLRLATPHLPDAIADPIKPAAFGFVATRFNDGDLAQTVADLSAVKEWGWWYTRYVVPGTIQEVPLYSFVKGDLHGHTFANGYVLFAGALAFAYYATPAEHKMRRRAIVFGGLGAVAGLFGFMNTWSLPTAVGLTILTVAAADAHPATLLPEGIADHLQPDETATAGDWVAFIAQEVWRLVLAVVAGVVVLLIGIAIASPFLVFGQVPSNNGIGFLPPRSPLGPWLVIYVGLVTIFALYVATRSWPTLEDVPNSWLGVGALLLVAAMAVLTFVFNFGVLAVLGPLILASWLLVRTDRGGFALVLLVAGAGLLLSFELVHAKLPETNFPRWNTALKVAVQGWTLGAAGAGGAIAIMLSKAYERVGQKLTQGDDESAESASDEDTSKQSSELPSVTTGALARSAGTVVLVVAVVLASAVFPVMMFATEIGSDIQNDRYNPTINGHEAAERFHANEYDALSWLKNRQGTPTIVEAPGRTYGWTSPAATFSGLPSVVGWDHEAEYRSPDAYKRRVNHVDAIYTGSMADTSQHLRQYDVTYVYVGPNEQERYGFDMRSFDHDAFSVAYRSGDVTIYEVDQSELPDA